MIGINIKSSELFKNNIKYKLSSIITGDNLLYSISQISNGKIIAVKEILDLKENYYFDQDYIKTLFEENNLLHNDIEEVSIAIENPDFSLIPKNLYKDSIKKELLAATSIKQYEKEYEIIKKHISKIDLYNLFLFPKHLKKFLEDDFNKVKFHHSNEIFIPKYDFIDSYENTLIANLNNNHLQTAVFKNGDFIQTNVYSIDSKEDILYYITANLSNNVIPVNKANVIISGRIDSDSSAYKLLYEHIKNISFVKNIPRLSFSNVFLGMPKHYFFDLYALSLCE
jgi:hypothetical protein